MGRKAFYIFSLKAEWSSEDISLPLAWPQTGTIEFQDYGLQYRKGLEFALKGISLHIQEKEKVKKLIHHTYQNTAQFNASFTSFLLIMKLHCHAFRSALWEGPVQGSHHWPWEFSASWRQQKERFT